MQFSLMVIKRGKAAVRQLPPCHLSLNVYRWSKGGKAGKAGKRMRNVPLANYVRVPGYTGLVQAKLDKMR